MHAQSIPLSCSGGIWRTLYRYLRRLPSKQQLRCLRTMEPLAYRESTCTNISVTCPWEIIAYSVLKHINTARMHTITRQFIPLIYGPLGKRILSKIQPTLPFLLLLLLSAFHIWVRHSGFSISSCSYRLHPPPSLQPQPCHLSPHP